MLKPFHELNERELLALAIASEEEDSKIYGSFAEKVRAEFPATAGIRSSATVDRHVPGAFRK
jgi:rubrerythrin